MSLSSARDATIHQRSQNSTDESNCRQQSVFLDSKSQSTLRSGIGKLLWHMQYSRPGISQAVRDLARHMMHGDKTHMDAMLYCMQYLVCTKDAGLFLKPERK